MTDEIMTDDEEINKAIDKCECRVEFDGASVCKAWTLPCATVIESGRCECLVKFFANNT